MATPSVWLWSSSSCPEKRTFSTVLRVGSPYLLISLTIWADLSVSYILQTFQVTTLVVAFIVRRFVGRLASRGLSPTCVISPLVEESLRVSPGLIPRNVYTLATNLIPEYNIVNKMILSIYYVLMDLRFPENLKIWHHLKIICHLFKKLKCVKRIKKWRFRRFTLNYWICNCAWFSHAITHFLTFSNWRKIIIFTKQMCNLFNL